VIRTATDERMENRALSLPAVCESRGRRRELEEPPHTRQRGGPSCAKSRRRFSRDDAGLADATLSGS
jgi:hypothetical protein